VGLHAGMVGPHDRNKEKGGIGDVDNGALTHFYCNSSKDRILQEIDLRNSLS